MGSSWCNHKKQILAETGQLSTSLYKIFLYSSRLNVISARKAKEMNLLWWRQFVEVVDHVLNVVKKTVLLMTTLNGDGLLNDMVNAGINCDDLIRIVADLIIAAGDTVTSTIQFYSITILLSCLLLIIIM